MCGCCSGFDTNRLDFWRVAVMQFREHPLGGIGSENFAVAYARERQSGEETLYPHSFVLEVLAQTGVVGSILFLAFLVAALTAAVASRSRREGVDRAVCSVCLVVFAYWFAHASIDWFWELPRSPHPRSASWPWRATRPGQCTPALRDLGTASAPVARGRTSRRRVRLVRLPVAVRA